jgi:DNA-binding response OmpR family regulator
MNMDKEADILIIDDDKDLVNAMLIILESKNYQVRKAYNGKEGYKQIEEKIPDLIVLDVMMATDTEGFDLAFKLRNNPAFKDIPIVMVTGFPEKMAEEGPERFQHIMGESWPVSQFIEKPVDPEQLLNTIELFLREAGKG